MAPRLLNKVLTRRSPAGDVVCSGRIVEVEAYRGSEDPASHAFRGPTRRNEVMFGPPGRMYVYFTYGMHWCANLVCREDGVAQAVLLRALAPIEGIDVIRTARGRDVRERDLLSGPARLCQGFGITGDDNGADVCSGDLGIVVKDDGVPPPARAGISGRIGIRLAADLPWRFFVPEDPNVSRAKPLVAPTPPG